MDDQERRAFMTALTYFAFTAVLFVIAYISFMPEYSSTFANAIGLIMIIIGFVCSLVGVAYLLIGIGNLPFSGSRDESHSSFSRLDDDPSEMSCPQCGSNCQYVEGEGWWCTECKKYF